MSKGSVSAKTILFIFLFCAIADFAWGYVRGRSIPVGVITVVFGLAGTAFYSYLLSVIHGRTDEKSDTHPR